MSSTLVEQVRAALVAARRDRDTARTPPHSTPLADIGNRELQLGRALRGAEALDGGIARGVLAG